MQKPTIIINAVHTKTGGGLVYLNNVLPFLAADTNFHWIILLNSKTNARIQVPANIQVISCSVPSNFLAMHAWEQLILPIMLWRLNPAAVLCNANYVPLLAPNPVPIIHTNTQVINFEKKLSAKIYWLLVHGLTRLSLWRSKGALSVARHIIDYYQASVDKVYVASPAVNHSQSSSTRAEQTLLAVGDLYIQKNYDLMIAAMEYICQKYPQAKLKIIGRPVIAAVAQSIDHQIKTLRLENNIERLNHVAHEQLMQHLQQATIYLNTSTVECFNMPVLEALSTGAPTIVLDYPFQREVAADAAIYLDKAISSQQFADKVCHLLSSPEQLHAFSDKAKNRAQQFCWQKTAATIIKKITEVIQ